MSGDADQSVFSVQELCVAEVIQDIDRNPAAIRYVLGSRTSQLVSSVEEILDQLCQSGDAEMVPGATSAKLTPTGRNRLDLSKNWTFEVIETFAVPRFSEYPLLRGRIRSGVIRPGDFFGNAAGTIGTVRDVGHAYSSTFDPGEGPVLRVDGGGFEPGDELVMFEPRGGAG